MAILPPHTARRSLRRALSLLGRSRISGSSGAPAIDAEQGAPPSHIFIVGLSRTGTSLLRSVLNASDQIAIAAGESHYLSSGGQFGPAGYRERFAAAGDLRTADGRRGVLDYLYSLEGRGFWARLAAEVPRELLEAKLAESDGTDRVLFDLAISHFAGGKPVAGEKTPDHIRHVPTLLSWFPRARAVHMLRDPRAVYLSSNAKEADWIERGEFVGPAARLRRRLGPIGRGYQLIRVARDFRQVIRLHDDYTQRFAGRYCMLQFEDLVTRPEAAVRGLCRQLGVAYQPRMLEQVVRNASFSAKGTQGFDPDAAERWRTQLTPTAQRSFAILSGSQMARFGYAA